MNINPLSNTSASINVSKFSVLSSKGKWKLSDSLKDKITQLAKEDAKDAVYMGNQYKALLQNEVAKVAPNRAAAMAKAISMMNTEEYIQSSKAMREADHRWLCMLMGLPYKAQFEIGSLGTGAHIFDENGDEIATFTPGVGWQTRSSKEETEVYDSMKFAYYDVYHTARESIKNVNAPQMNRNGENIESNSDIYSTMEFHAKV
ncbi:MAG: hypothetical protein H2184_09395 [Candidatus Galacturonibacter soehngenii]|nr:hypothetical protein [Candidatus Galacturonibacter soehngenii]